MAADGKTKRLHLHHQGEFQHQNCTRGSLHDSDHEDVVRILAGLSCELCIICITQHNFPPTRSVILQFAGRLIVIGKIWLPIIIGASVSEPHTSVTSLRRACVSMLACCLLACHLANTVNFSEFPLHVHNNIQIQQRALYAPRYAGCKNREPSSSSSYLFDGR